MLNQMPNFEIVEQDDKVVTIRDIGPWDKYPTVTNGAEAVVKSMFKALNGRRLKYYDSLGTFDELIYDFKTGEFIGYCAG